jgi:hypothetical protein
MLTFLLLTAFALVFGGLVWLVTLPIRFLFRVVFGGIGLVLGGLGGLFGAIVGGLGALFGLAVAAVVMVALAGAFVAALLALLAPLVPVVLLLGLGWAIYRGSRQPTATF